ncbi:MAG: CPBP family intramembrane metalloprotease [Gammaproteobacteria bacterium]|nr:CPBP family intramembrane metalloprotease [Gammaproteobacteria bacterium]
MAITLGQARAATVAALGGGLFFFAAVGTVLGLAFTNLRLSPAVIWFPLPALAVVCGVAAWAQRRFDVGLRLPPRPLWPLLAAFGLTSMIASHAVLVLEGAFHGITREFEAPPAQLGAVAALIWWVGIVVGMSTASEVAFRGIIQTRLAPLVGVGGAIAAATAINWISHRWDGLAERAVGVVAILLAWSWLRQLSGSTIATLVAHIGAVAAWDIILWRFGPWDHAAMSGGELVLTAVVGFAALAASLWIARRIHQQCIR